MAISTTPQRERVRSPLEVRTLLAERPVDVKCCEECPGWVVSSVDDWRGRVIERCDECDANARAAGLPYLGWDDDVSQLPEARAALVAEVAGPVPYLSARERERYYSCILREHDLVTALADIIAHCGDDDGEAMRRIHEIADKACERYHRDWKGA